MNTLLVRLEMPDVVIDQFGNKGFWTLVYDQGFEVVVNGNKYWAFFNYTTAGKGKCINFINFSSLQSLQY